MPRDNPDVPADDHPEAGKDSDEFTMPKERIARVRRFALRVFLIFAPGYLYLGWSLIGDLTPILALQVVAWIALLGASVLIPFGTLAKAFIRDPQTVDKFTWLGGITMGWLSTVFVLAIIRDISLLFVADPDLWAGQTALTVVGLSLGITALGFFNARRTARVKRVSVTLDHLAPALDGFTIAQLSDIHVGPTIKAGYVRGIVNRVNGLNADLVAITGDVVDGRVRDLEADTRPLSELTGRHGVFVCTGNHEYYSGPEEWIEQFRRYDHTVLLNEHRVLDHDGAAVVIAGITDYSAGRFNPDWASDADAAITGAPETAPKVLLAHQPRSAAAADRAGFDLQLSGHTHGGQFWPWNYFVRFQQPVVAGLKRFGKLWVYTSRGTGYWGPPKRFGAPSEITLITLRAAKT